MLITVTAASALPVSVKDAGDQLGMCEAELADHGSLVERLIRSAASLVEAEAAITLQPTDFEQRLDSWPCGPMALETGPVRDVAEIAYLDADGNEQPLSASDWDWEPTSEGAVVWLRSGFAAPELQQLRRGAVRIRFAAGFNDPAASEGDPRLDLPERARLAVLVLVAHWFRNREAEGSPTRAADRLINSIRVYR